MRRLSERVHYQNELIFPQKTPDCDKLIRNNHIKTKGSDDWYLLSQKWIGIITSEMAGTEVLTDKIIVNNKSVTLKETIAFVS